MRRDPAQQRSGPDGALNRHGQVGKRMVPLPYFFLQFGGEVGAFILSLREQPLWLVTRGTKSGGLADNQRPIIYEPFRNRPAQRTIMARD